MAEEKERKANGTRKVKKPKSNETKQEGRLASTKGNGKLKRRKAGTRTTGVKSSEDETSKKPETRVKRTTRRTMRGRKAALNKTSEDSALNESSATILNSSTTGTKLSSRRVAAAGSRRNANKSKGLKTASKAERSAISKRRANKTDTKNSKTSTKKNTKGKKKKIEDKNLCSVCKDVESTLGGMCTHNFCLKCFKSVISKRLDSSELHDNHLNAPTMGKCPKCTCEVKKFEMRVCKDGKITEDLAFADHKQTVIKNSRIAGKVFAPSKGTDPTFCFNEDRPYIDVTECVDADIDNWVLNDGYPVPDKLPFEEGCFFDEDTRTFHGKVKWPETFRGAYQWDVILSFKKNYNAMDAGIIHERKERVLDEDVVEAVKTLVPADSEEEIVRLQYPFDGDWELTWRNSDNQEKIAKVTVRNNQFLRGQHLFNLNMSDPSNVLFRWPGALYTAIVEKGANLTENPKGPEIDEVVSWKTMHPDFPEGFTWERLTIGELPIPETLRLGLGNNKYVARSGDELLSRKHSTFDDSDNFSETNSVESNHENNSEPDNEDTSLLKVMGSSSVPVYYDFDFGLHSLNKYDTPGRLYSDESNNPNTRHGLAQDPLFRDLFAS